MLLSRLQSIQKNANLHSLSKLYINQVFTSLFIKIASVGITLLYVPLILGYLNQEKYGIWITLTTIVNWIGILDIGMANGLRNKLAEALAKDDIKMGKIYVSTTYAFLGGIFMIVLIAFHLINPFINWQNLLNTHLLKKQELFLITSLVVTFVILRFIVQTITVLDSAHGNSAKGSLLLAISSGLSLVLVWLATLFTEKGNLLLLSAIVTVTPVAVYSVYTLFAFKKRFKALLPSRAFVKFEYSKSLIGLSLQFFIVQITSTILYASTPFIITQLFNPSAVTQFSIATSIFNMPIMVFGLICSPIVPLVTQAYIKEDLLWLKSTLKKMFYFSLLFSGGVLLMIIISGWIYKVWLGSKVHIPQNLSIAIGCYTIINILVTPFSNFINGLGKIKILTILAPIGIGMFIILSITLSKFLNDVTGVSIALSLTSLVGLIILPIHIKKLINKKTAQQITT